MTLRKPSDSDTDLAHIGEAHALSRIPGHCRNPGPDKSAQGSERQNEAQKFDSCKSRYAPLADHKLILVVSMATATQIGHLKSHPPLAESIIQAAEAQGSDISRPSSDRGTGSRKWRQRRRVGWPAKRSTMAASPQTGALAPWEFMIRCLFSSPRGLTKFACTCHADPTTDPVKNVR